MKHTLDFQDGGSAGYQCDGKDTGAIIDSDEGPQRCPRCGQLLRLIWDVRLEEVDTTEEAP